MKKRARSVHPLQEAHATEILAPLGLTRGTGIFGNSTRIFVDEILTTEQ